MGSLQANVINARIQTRIALEKKENPDMYASVADSSGHYIKWNEPVTKDKPGVTYDSRSHKRLRML